MFSFGMITYKQSDKTLERAISAFQSIGATHFKASVLNNFRQGITEKTYLEICRQINWVIKLGVNTIRINDSVGSLQPHITKWLCSALVEQFPNITFCLHTHNDNGLAVANAMCSIQAGFQMIEGSLAGFGNRSGIAPLEQIVKLCKTNNIQVSKHDINLAKLINAAQETEKIFLQLPNVFRPVSGIFETNSNFGVLNIPDFLTTDDKKNYFVNYAGLHPQTIRQALNTYFPTIDTTTISEGKLWGIINHIKIFMESSIHNIENRYNHLFDNVIEFYSNATFTPEQLANHANNLLRAED